MKTKIKNTRCKYRFDEKRDPIVEGYEYRENHQVHVLHDLCELMCYPHSDRKCINYTYDHSTCPMAKSVGKKKKKKKKV